MIAVWTVCRLCVWLVFCWCYLTAAYFRRRHASAEAIAASPGDGKGKGEWCEIEQLMARRDEHLLARSLKRWEGRRDGCRAAQEWFGKARSRRLAYACGAADAWLLWALERSGTFDVWEFAVNVADTLASLGNGG